MTDVEKKLIPEEDWQFVLAYLDPEDRRRPTHVLAGIWEHPTGYLSWTKHTLSEQSEHLSQLAAMPPDPSNSDPNGKAQHVEK